MKELFMTILIKMQTNEQPSSLAVILQFIENSWPFVITFGAVWKGISEVAKIYSTRQEAKLKALIQSEVSPTFEKLQDSIDKLTESINQMKYGK